MCFLSVFYLDNSNLIVDYLFNDFAEDELTQEAE